MGSSLSVEEEEPSLRSHAISNGEQNESGVAEEAEAAEMNQHAADEPPPQQEEEETPRQQQQEEAEYPFDEAFVTPATMTASASWSQIANQQEMMLHNPTMNNTRLEETPDAASRRVPEDDSADENNNSRRHIRRQSSELLFRGSFPALTTSTEAHNHAGPWNLMMHHPSDDPWQMEADPSLAPQEPDLAFTVSEPTFATSVSYITDPQEQQQVLSELLASEYHQFTAAAAPNADEIEHAQDNNPGSFVELAAAAGRVICPSEITDILCPTEVTDTLLGTDHGDDIMPPSSFPTTTADPVPDIAQSDSWLPTSLLPAGYGGRDYAEQRALEMSDPAAIERTNENDVGDFVPPISPHCEWMGRNVETLLHGHVSVAPMLVRDDQHSTSDASGSRRRSRSQSPTSLVHGGTLANYIHARPQIRSNDESDENAEGHLETRAPMQGTSNGAGPNVVLSLLARETTGKPGSTRSLPRVERLRRIGGESLYAAVDRPAGGILSEMALLEESMDRGDWTETQSIISRLASRLVGDSTITLLVNGERNRDPIDDPTLPPSASSFYAGGGRIGLERDAFVLAGGVELLLRVFREPAFVGEQVGQSNDARDLSGEMVRNKFAGSWNEVFATLRELVYVLPHIVEEGIILDDGNFIPFLFTLLAHDSVFDGAAVMIEEILSLQSLAQTTMRLEEDLATDPSGQTWTSSTFYLGNIPDLYELWGNFSCRQLAHFCRILALLIFEPEDRQVFENPGVLKSMELLQLRRDRAVRAGRDATVDMNQAILIGDPSIMMKLLQLLRIMNYAPSVQRIQAYRMMAHYPFVAETLGMVGLTEISDWSDVGRLENLARTLAANDPEVQVSDIGRVTQMLEGLALRLQFADPLDPATQIGNIIHVITAAQEAGIVVGRQRNAANRPSASAERRSMAAEDTADRTSNAPGRGPPANEDDNLASASWAFPEQVILRSLYSRRGGDGGGGVADGADANGDVQVVGIGVEGGVNGQPAVHHLHTGDTSRRSHINSPQDAANELQFNAFVLASYQVEVLFILCTLLGGRRKADTQTFLHDNGLIEILDEMFHRLTWGCSTNILGGGNAPDQQDTNDSDRSAGIHGPGCDCTPESALCIQYLRLVHNFCDRDCDNYTARRSLLSSAERSYTFDAESNNLRAQELQPGLLSKVIKTLMDEPDDSPYRFWLASCIESFLRGSALQEQLFVANSGLLSHLVDDIISDRLHCAGSLQTSFDLLGELCKGNEDVLRLLMMNLNEERFERLMSTAAANLIDSNVFLRSLLLTVEHVHATGTTLNNVESHPRLYLTHSWWDTSMTRLSVDSNENGASGDVQEDRLSRPADWFPPHGVDTTSSATACVHADHGATTSSDIAFGWVCYPDPVSPTANWQQHSLVAAPNTIERLAWFLNTNRARLLRDLLGVVDLQNINHENICCLNTALVVTILANRRNELPQLLDVLRRIVREEKLESKQRMKNAAEYNAGQANDYEQALDRSFIQSMKLLDLEDGRQRDTLGRRRMSVGGQNNVSFSSSLDGPIDVMRNFRELLWFWSEYYSHRGRDRLSLEFSSRLRFDEWRSLVASLTADDGSQTSLVASPVRLPRSPYQRSSQVNDGPSRAR